ncbi:MAG TPA: hypothetical protein VGS20_10400 [Candidatus Acidoferrales bacterium]|nr:hypothetical protein [Candidatus Acidoferrales bacterium]
MKRWFAVFAVLAASALVLVPGARAQEETGQPASDFNHLHFRDLGPAVAGGRVASVVGIPGNPNVYYVGAGGGGVWKTTNAGESWKAIFEHAATSSIGAVALAPSNPSLVWVGTGEANPRNDVFDGAGLYFSPDGGHTWQLMGFKDAGQISSVLVDPHDSNTVYVGVLGHVWGPNPDRGVFKTTDGGKTWRKVLFVNDSTGVSDMVMGPDNPKVLFAGMWQFRRYPWTLESGGEGSGLYRSVDGGETWKKLVKGLPDGPLGRIAVAVAPSNPDHVYALIEAKKGMLWQSLDMGDLWTAVSDSHAIDVRPFYFSRVFVAPNNENKLYFLSFQLMESDDGGKTARQIDQGVHPDHHALWIDPANPDRILQGNDGGVYLTSDGGKTWRFLDGLPIEQEYMMGVGADVPYTLCTGLQDNSAWCGGERGWYTVTGGDGQYALQAPSDPNIVYTDSQNGSISRLDKTHHIRWSIRPSLVGVEQEAPANLKYRFNWTSPIAVSPTDPNEVYIGANALLRSADGGRTWTAISPDLTRNDKSKQITSGGAIDYDISGAETYDTIMSITLAPSDPKVIWVGSDDGMVHLSRDGGKTWTDLTPNIAGAPQWARVYQIGVSPFDAGKAYVIFDAHMLDDHHPYVYRTSDYGKTWQSITAGLPEEPVHVVREDPNRRGMLVLGNDQGLYLSADDGDHWEKFPVEFPTVPVWDVNFAKTEHDLAVATHGRGTFVLNDIRPVEEMSSEVAAADFHLFTVNDAILYNRVFGMEEGRNSTTYRLPPAPQGAAIDYLLKAAIKAPERPGPAGPRRGPVKIVVTDEAGHAVATDYGPGEAGINRFVWNLRYDGPTPLRGEPQPQRGGGGGFFGGGGAPQVAPGAYKIAVTAGGQTQTQTVTVRSDPNVQTDPAGFKAEEAYGVEARDMLSAVNGMVNRINDLEGQVTGFANAARPENGRMADVRYEHVLGEGRSLHQQLEKMKASVYNTTLQRAAPEDDIHYLTDFRGDVEQLMRGASVGYGLPPSPQAVERLAELRKQLDQHLTAFNQMLRTEVAAYNRLAAQAGVPTLFAGEPISLKGAGAVAAGGGR